MNYRRKQPAIKPMFVSAEESTCGWWSPVPTSQTPKSGKVSFNSSLKKELRSGLASINREINFRNGESTASESLKECPRGKENIGARCKSQDDCQDQDQDKDKDKEKEIILQWFNKVRNSDVIE
jgi:hypothetical protein